jgi:multiple antibiotic resistance protein
VSFDFSQAIAAFMAFFAVMNPISNTPIFLALTAGQSHLVRKKIALHAVIVAFCITTLFCVLGQQIFSLFGITLYAFKVTGGLLIISIGFEMLHGETSKVQKPSLRAHEDSLDRLLSVAVSPLGIPLLSGPGTITTAVNYGATGKPGDMILTILAFGLLCALTFFAFIFSKEIQKYLGQIGLNVVTRLMGLILGVVGVQMLITGLKGAFPLLN